MAKSTAKVKETAKETAKEMARVKKVDLDDEVNLVLVQELAKKTEKATVVVWVHRLECLLFLLRH